MAAPTLSTLPTEILVHVCNFLYDLHIPSLEAFSLGNKRCFEIAASVRVHTITFRIHIPARLSKDVNKCKALLDRHGAGVFQHVRRLVIVGRMDSPYCAKGYGGMNPIWEDALDKSESEDDEDNRQPDDHHDETVAQKKHKKPTFHFSMPATTDWEATHDQVHDFPFESEHGRGAMTFRRQPDMGYHSAPDHPPANAAYDSDHHWLPLANLISRLPGLADVVYRCPSQFPPCLLKAVHASGNRARLRLHLQMFKLRSASESATIDPYEWELITSPCLYSIWPHYGIQVAGSGEQHPSRQLDAVMWMLRQAPASSRLREINVAGSSDVEKVATPLLPSPPPPNSITEFGGPVVPWNQTAFFHQEQSEAPRASACNNGHLRHLRFDSAVPSTPHESIFGRGSGNWIEKWDGLTDFSLLRTLALVQPVSQAQVLSLQSTRLPEMAALSLVCERPPFMEGETACSGFDYFQTITAFLSSLPSLTALQVAAWDHARHMFSFHSSKLEKLALIPVEYWTRSISRDIRNFLTLRELAALASSFPRLTDLSISVRRSRGNSAEVALYRYIGEHMPSLRRLSLRLDCSPPNHIATDQDGHDTPLPEPYPCGPGSPPVSAALNRYKDQYAPEDSWMHRHRNGHIYDVLINSALDASLARQIFNAVGGNIETLLVRTYGGRDFPQVWPPPHYHEPVMFPEPVGELLDPFLYNYDWEPVDGAEGEQRASRQKIEPRKSQALHGLYLDSQVR